MDILSRFSLKRTLHVFFMSENRGLTTTVNHILALGITSLLVLGLLIGANTLIGNQNEDTTRQSLDTVGNQLAEEIMTVDRLSSESANATLWVTQPAQVAGSGYSVRIEHGPECNTPRISSDTCLVMTAASPDVTRKIPVQNQTDISITEVDPGRFKLIAERAEVDNGVQSTQPVEIPEATMRHGIGQNVSEDAIGVVGDTAFNIPPTSLSIRVDPGRPSTNGPIEFTASANDKDGDNSNLAYEWDFDDGDTATGKQVSHDYSTPGVYEVALTVTDEDGATSTETLNVSVAGLEYQGDLQEQCTPDCQLSFSLHNEWNNGDIDNTAKITGVRIDIVGDETRQVDFGDDTDFDDWTLRVAPDDSADTAWRFSHKFPIRENGTMVPLSSSIFKHKDHVDTPRWMEFPPGTVGRQNDASIDIREYGTSLVGQQVRIAIQHRINGRINTTEFTDTVTVTPP